jgi:hypothetical protein
MIGAGKPPVHLWIYNHPFHGISDQVEFFLSVLRQNGHAVTAGRRPSDDALNVVIENFSDATASTLIDFCQSRSKRVSVIMTEHLDFVNHEIFIHGAPLWNDNDYMHPATQIARIQSLMACACHIRGFLVLGDLPELKNMHSMMPGIAVRTLPFPQLTAPAPPADWQALPADLIFTGVVTSYRAELLGELGKAFNVRTPNEFIPRKARDLFSQTGRLVLNLPQRPDWRWLSLMRIIAALRCGRATVSLGTQDASKIAACCIQLDVQQPDWLAQLRHLTQRPGEIFAQAFADYQAMAKAFSRQNKFPQDFFEYWAMTEL